MIRFFVFWLIITSSIFFTVAAIAQENAFKVSSSYVVKIETFTNNSLKSSDLLEQKLLIDALIDPNTNAADIRSQIETITVDIKAMFKPEMKEWQKLEILRKYVYDSGPWNNKRPFSYDLNDPQGTSHLSRRLDYYLRTRKGNCVSMPILYAILGQRLGLDMKLSTAPLHVFVKYTNQQGETVNIETTSGGYPARDAWYQNNLPMLPKAVQNGMYMKSLSPEESLAVLGHDLTNHLTRNGRYDDAILVSERLIKLFPNYAPLYMSRGSAFYKLVEREFQNKYPDISDVPEDQKAGLQFLLTQNMISFQLAEQLGWRDPDELKKELETQAK